MRQLIGPYSVVTWNVSHLQMSTPGLAYLNRRTLTYYLRAILHALYKVAAEDFEQAGRKLKEKNLFPNKIH